MNTHASMTTSGSKMIKTSHKESVFNASKADPQGCCCLGPFKRKKTSKQPRTPVNEQWMPILVS